MASLGYIVNCCLTKMKIPPTASGAVCVAPSPRQTWDWSCEEAAENTQTHTVVDETPKGVKSANKAHVNVKAGRGRWFPGAPQ